MPMQTQIYNDKKGRMSLVYRKNIIHKQDISLMKDSVAFQVRDRKFSRKASDKEIKPQKVTMILVATTCIVSGN